MINYQDILAQQGSISHLSERIGAVTDQSRSTVLSRLIRWKNALPANVQQLGIDLQVCGYQLQAVKIEGLPDDVMVVRFDPIKYIYRSDCGKVWDNVIDLLSYCDNQGLSSVYSDKTKTIYGVTTCN